MHYKYHGIYNLFLYVPEIHKNELREDFEKALKEFIKYFKVLPFINTVINVKITLLKTLTFW